MGLLLIVKSVGHGPSSFFSAGLLQKSPRLRGQRRCGAAATARAWRTAKVGANYAKKIQLVTVQTSPTPGNCLHPLDLSAPVRCIAEDSLHCIPPTSCTFGNRGGINLPAAGTCTNSRTRTSGLHHERLDGIQRMLRLSFRQPASQHRPRRGGSRPSQRRQQS